MPALKRCELDEYVAYTSNNISNHVTASVKSTLCLLNTTSADTMEILGSAVFPDNTGLLSSEKSPSERDLEIEVLDIDQFGILPDTGEENIENCSDSVNEHLTNNSSVNVFSSPAKSDGSTISVGKARGRVTGKIQIRNYKCNHCGFSTQNSREHLHHLRDMHNEEFDIHECNTCEYASKHIKNLERHCSVIHAENTQNKVISNKLSKYLSRVPKGRKYKRSRKFPCNLCNFVAPSKRILRSHVILHIQPVKENTDIAEVNSKKYSECNEIPKEDQSTFHSVDESSALTDNLNSQKGLKCPLCKMDVRYISWLIRHLRKNHRENVRAQALAVAYENKKRSKRPNYAGLEIDHSDILEKGMKRRIVSKSGQMKIDGFFTFSATSTQSLSNNQNEISNGKSHIDHAVKCDICYQKFKGLLELREHMQSHSTSSISDYSVKSYNDINCDNFDATPNVSKSAALKRVRRVLGSKISNSKHYKCPYCPFTIQSVSRFHVHFIQHMKNLQFRCSDCDYHSSWKWTVVKHIWSKVRNERNHFNASVFTNNELVDLNSFKLYEKYLINQPKSFSHYLSTSLNAMQGNHSTCFQSAKSSILFNDGADIVDSSYETSSIPLSCNVPDSSRETNYYHCKECSFKSVNKQIVINHLASHAGIKPFLCGVCNFKSNWKFAMVRHMKTLHPGCDNIITQKVNFTQEGYVLCQKSTFENTDKSNEHPKVVTKQPKLVARPFRFRCRICPYATYKKYHFEFHKKQHRRKEGTFYECDRCPYFVKFAKSLIKHKNLHALAEAPNTTDYLKVDNCKEEFESSARVTTPLKKYFRKKSLACSICPARFSQQNRLSRHLELHGKNYRHKCDICDYSVPDAINLVKHKKVHELKTNVESPSSAKSPSPAKSFACPVCPAVFSLKHRYIRHVKFHSKNYNDRCVSSASIEGNESVIRPKKMQYIKRKSRPGFSKSFSCPKCPTLISSPERYERHLELHGKNYRFTCSQCDFSVQNAVNLKKHELIHNRYRERQNSIYPENLNSVDIVQEPVVVEPLPNPNEKKLFICDRCPYYSGSKTAVQSHQRSHWLKQIYECPHCDYSAVTRNSLHSHVKLHLESSKLFPPEAFMKFQSFKIVVQEENGEKLVFDDETMVNDERHFEAQNNRLVVNETMENIQNNSAKCCEFEETNENHSDDDDMKSEDSSHSVIKPVVVLTDIFK